MASADRDVEVSSREVAFHIEHPREDSHSRAHAQAHASPRAAGAGAGTGAAAAAAPASTDRTVNTAAISLSKVERRHDTEKKEAHHYGHGGVEMTATGGGIGGAYPGFSNDALYGDARQRAKVGGMGGGYDEKTGRYHDDLPRASFGEQLLAGLTRPTNLTAGERPKQGMSSTGVSNFGEQSSYEKVSSLPPQESWWPYWASLPCAWYPYNVNLQAYRLGMAVVVALCILGIVEREHRWLHYVVLGLTVDYFCRMMAGPRASLCTLIGEMADTLFNMCRVRGAHKGLFPASYVAGSPYQFSDFCGLLLLIGATIALFVSNDEDEEGGEAAGSVFLGILALIAFIELVLGFPLFVWCFNKLVGAGWIWKDSEIKSAMLREEWQQWNKSDQMRLQEARTQLKDTTHQLRPQQVSYAGRGKRALPYTYRTANEYHKRLDFHPIKNMKVSYFLMSSTLASLAWVWGAAATEAGFDHGNVMWHILVITALVFFALHLLLWMIKLALYPAHVVWEWEHPIYRPLFLALPLNWLLFIPLIVQADEQTLAEVVFWMGAPLLLFLSVWIMALLWHQHEFWEVYSASYFIIPLSNALCAYFLPLVHSSYSEAAWLWLGISVFMWLILSTIQFLKATMFPRPSDPFRYVLWFMMACAFAIAIGSVGIYSRARVETINPADNLQTLSTGTTGAPVIARNQNYNVFGGPTGDSVFLPAVTEGSFVNFFSQGLAFNLVPTPTNTINGAAAGSALGIPTSANGARCIADATAAGWLCSLGAPQAANTVVAPAWTDLALATYYIGLILFVLLFLLALMAYFGRRSFNMLWWAPGLALCIMSVATILHHSLHRSATTTGIAATALTITNIYVALCFLNHLRKLLQLKLYRPDRLTLSPLEFFRLPNKALREALFEMQAHVQNPQASAEEWREFEYVLLPHYAMCAAAFGELKRLTIYPTLTTWFGSNVIRPLDENARALDHELTRLFERMQATTRMEINSPARAAAEAENRKDFSTFVASAHAHMDEEEVHVFNLAKRYIGAKEATDMIRRCWDEISPERWANILPFVVEFLRHDRLRARWLECLTEALPENAPLAGKFLYEALDPFLYERIIVDVPEIRPRMTKGYQRMW